MLSLVRALGALGLLALLTPGFSADMPDYTDMCELKPEVSTKKLVRPDEAANLLHFVLAPIDPCVEGELDVMARFTVIDRKGKRCSKRYTPYYVNYKDASGTLMMASAWVVACSEHVEPDFAGMVRGVWYQMAVRMSNLPPASMVAYQLGRLGGKTPKAAWKQFMSPLPAGMSSDKPVLVVGDTDPRNAILALPATGDPTQYGLALHMGDTSYGDMVMDEDDALFLCFFATFDTPPEHPCGFACKPDVCHDATVDMNNQLSAIRVWIDLMDQTLGGRVVMGMTTGNHDKFLPYTGTYVAPIATAGVDPMYMPDLGGNALQKLADRRVSVTEKRGIMSERGKSPPFHSFDHGLAHIVSIGTEDNPANAFEGWDGLPLSEAMMERWNQRYGPESPMYKWLEQDLMKAAANRDLVPWIIVYTHRPMYHTSGRRPMCMFEGANRDWFGCMYMELYDPLFAKYGVNVYLSGHSHHYYRSHPIRMNELNERSGTVHMIVGNSGARVQGENWIHTPSWLAYRQGTMSGFSTFTLTRTTMSWAHTHAETGEVLDAAEIPNLFL